MTRAEVEAGWTNGNDSFKEIAGLTGVNVSVIIRVEREVHGHDQVQTDI